MIVRKFRHAINLLFEVKEKWEKFLSVYHLSPYIHIFQFHIHPHITFIIIHLLMRSALNSWAEEENKEEIISIMEWLSCGVCVCVYFFMLSLNTQISVHPPHTSSECCMKL